MQLGQNVPVALKEHGALFGEEGGAGRGLGKVVLVGAPVILLQSDVELHRLGGGGLGETGLRLVLVENVAAVLVHKVPVAQLVVAVGHVAVLAGGVIDFLGRVGQIVPGPAFVGVAHAGGVKHFLIVDKAHGVLVLGNGVQRAVRAAGVGEGHLREFAGVHDVGAVRQHAVVGVFQQLVGVHPEDVRHLAAGGSGLQLGPVFVPAGHLHLDLHVGVLGGVGITHGLHTVPLGHVPDLEGQVDIAVRSRAALVAAAAAHKARSHARCQQSGSHAFHVFHLNFSFRNCRGR